MNDMEIFRDIIRYVGGKLIMISNYDKISKKIE